MPAFLTMLLVTAEVFKTKFGGQGKCVLGIFALPGHHITSSSSSSSSTDLSNGRRIVIAVTQHDHYYTGKQDEELSAETTQDHVHEGLQQLGFTVPREQIVIVSG